MLSIGRPATNERPQDHTPGEQVRAFVTVALAFFLTGVVLAVTTNSLSGASPLLGRVKSQIFSPILVPAWLDVGYDYRITYGLEEDADHEIDLRTHGSDAPGLTLPGSLTGERASRWRRLARTIAVGGVDDDGGVVAAGLARGGFAALGAEDVDLRVFRVPQAERLAGDRAAAEQVYEARIRRVGDDVQLIRDEPAGELAPLVTPGSLAVPEETP